MLDKLGKKVENVTKFTTITLGAVYRGFVFYPWSFYCAWFYPLDFAYCFGKKRNNKRPEENIGAPRKSSGQTSQTDIMSLLKEPHLLMHLVARCRLH